MKKVFLLPLLIIVVNCFGQSITTKLSNAFENFEKDSQLVNAISSLYVIDAKTGEVVFEKNSSIGLAPASTQKIITSATAYELLGKDFQYKTEFGKNNVDRSLYIKGSGDPTLGSWRWKQTSEQEVMGRIVKAARKAGFTSFSKLIINTNGWEEETIPDGWIWQDIGNYYGAGAQGLNWRENQYDLILKSGQTIGDPVTVVETIPKLYEVGLTSYVKSAAKGTGDNSYIYLPIGSSNGEVRGTVPVNEDRFKISGAMPSVKNQFGRTLLDSFAKNKMYNLSSELVKVTSSDNLTDKGTIFHTEQSPVLDSIIYWFLKKSINLYGEALIKTFAYQKEGIGSTDKGVDIVKNYWKEKGISSTELNIVDGSGLSPLNRVTTHAQVTVLQFAKKQSWYNGFYEALPEYNGMKIKSGTIQGAKGFCGYHTSKEGREYIFSFLVNNYNGSASAVVRKMYKVLDELK